jgi:hypothetical protein
VLRVLNEGEEGFADIPKWQKRMFWLFPSKSVGLDGRAYNNWIRIPKPFQLGMIFATLPELAVERIFYKDPNAFDGFIEELLSQSIASPVPTGLVVPYEVWANKSTFTDRNVVPRSRERLLPEYQYSAYTTQTAKAVGRGLANLPAGGSEVDLPVLGELRRSKLASPAIIEHVVRGWTGGLGTTMLGLLDEALQSQGIVPNVIEPTKTWSDMPFVKGFTVRHPSMGAEPIAEFFERSEPYAQNFATFQALAKQGDGADALRVAEQSVGKMANLSKIRQALSRMGSAANMIRANDQFSADEKRQMIDEIYLTAVVTARSANEALDKYEASQRSKKR